MIDIPCKICGSNLWSLHKCGSGALDIKCSVCGYEVFITQISRVAALIDLLETAGDNK